MELLLGGGKSTHIDDADLDLVFGLRLYAHKDNRSENWYVVYAVKVDGKWKHRSLARLILGLGVGDKREAEHIEPGSTLDNRRSNLRIATRAQNNANRRMRKDNTSGHKGVVRYGAGWRAQIMVNGVGIALGTMPTKEEAFEVYCEAAKRLHGDFACPERRIDAQV